MEEQINTTVIQKALVLRGTMTKLEKNALREYRARWQAVAEIEAQELKQTTIQQRWRQLNALLQMADELGLHRGAQDERELQVVRDRWLKLKARSR